MSSRKSVRDSALPRPWCSDMRLHKLRRERGVQFLHTRLHVDNACLSSERQSTTMSQISGGTTDTIRDRVKAAAWKRLNMSVLKLSCNALKLSRGHRNVPVQGDTRPSKVVQDKGPTHAASLATRPRPPATRPQQQTHPTYPTLT